AERFITALVARGCRIPTAIGARRGDGLGCTKAVTGWLGSLSNVDGHPSAMPASPMTIRRPGTDSTRKIAQRYGGYGVGLPGGGPPKEIGSRPFGQTSPETATAQT